MFLTRLRPRQSSFAYALGLVSAIAMVGAEGAQPQTTKPTILLVHGAMAWKRQALCATVRPNQPEVCDEPTRGR